MKDKIVLLQPLQPLQSPMCIKKFEFIDALIPFYINPNNNTNPNPNNTNMGRIHFSTLLLSFILLLLGSLALGAGTIRPSTATLKREVAKAKAVGHTALLEQHNRLSSQSVVAPENFHFQASVPIRGANTLLVLRSNVFAPSTAFPIGTTFTVERDSVVHGGGGSIRSLLSLWSIVLPPSSALLVPSVPHLVSKGTDMIVPTNSNVFVFTEPSFGGICHKGGERESYEIGSFMLVPVMMTKNTASIATAYTSPSMGGCEVAVSNGTMVGGIRSIVVHVERVLVTSATGTKQVLSSGVHSDVAILGSSIITTVSINRSYARLCDDGGKECHHVLDSQTDLYTQTFTHFHIPHPYELEVRTKKGLISLIGEGSVSLTMSMCSQQDPCQLTMRSLDYADDQPVVCTGTACFRVHAEYTGLLPLRKIHVPTGFLLRVHYNTALYRSYSYTTGTYYLEWCVLESCTSHWIEIKRF